MTPRPDTSLPHLLPVKEAARLLRVGDSKVRRLAHEGQLEGFDVAGVMRISEESIVRYLGDNRVGPRRIGG